MRSIILSSLILCSSFTFADINSTTKEEMINDAITLINPKVIIQSITQEFTKHLPKEQQLVFNGIIDQYLDTESISSQLKEKAMVEFSTDEIALLRNAISTVSKDITKGKTRKFGVEAISLLHKELIIAIQKYQLSQQ